MGKRKFAVRDSSIRSLPQLFKVEPSPSIGQHEHVQRIARDLHDGVLQALVGVKIQLELALEAEDLGVGARKVLRSSISSLGCNIGEIRSIVYGDAAPTVKNASLTDALESAVQVFAEREPSIEARFRVFGDLQVPLHSSLLIGACYRMVQEALSNVAQHARANRVSVDLFGRDSGIRLKIQDDGDGFPEEFHIRDHSGLANTAQRAHELGGQMKIDGFSAGATIIVNIPWGNPRASIHSKNH